MDRQGAHGRLHVRTHRKFVFGTVSDELNLIKTLGQEGNHPGGLHKAVHEGLPTVGRNGHLATMAWVWADPGPDRPQPPLLTEGNDDILASVTEVNP